MLFQQKTECGISYLRNRKKEKTNTIPNLTKCFRWSSLTNFNGGHTGSRKSAFKEILDKSNNLTTRTNSIGL